MTNGMNRYQKQIFFAPIGKTGQAKLQQSRVLLCGCGALGSVIADQLARAGVGFLRIVDRDFVDLTNLQRQVLYDERDVEESLPKVIAAAKKLGQINSTIEIEPIVADIHAGNIEEFTEGIDLILDGTDNFETRFLINDVSLETGIPWINGGCLGGDGQTMTIFPGKTACLRCLMEDIPPAGTGETCDTAGILGATVTIVASMQVIDALKILSGHPELVSPELTIVDVWRNEHRKINLKSLRADSQENSQCPACQKGKRDWLHGRKSTEFHKMCGRNSVQLTPPHQDAISFETLKVQLEKTCVVTSNPYLLKAKLPGDEQYVIHLFQDGRAIIQGTEDVTVARSLYAKYVGH